MKLHHETPLMTVDRLTGVERVLEDCQLELRRIEPAEAELHSRIGAEVFGVPGEVMAQAAGPPVLSLPQARCYIGELDGVAVATSLAFLVDQHLDLHRRDAHRPARSRLRRRSHRDRRRQVAQRGYS